MDYIIRPSIDISDVFYLQSHILYIATSRNINHYNPSTTVHFYTNINGREGIIAAGIMLDWPIMPKHVPSVYQKDLYAKELRQFPIHFTRISPEIYFDKKHLFQLPAMNMHNKTDLTKPDHLYRVWNLGLQLSFIRYKRDRHWNTEGNSSLTDGHYRLWFHELRENVFKITFNTMVSGKNSCSLCKMKYEPNEVLCNDFLEFHERLDIDFDENYRRISKGNFMIVCPNCHKKEHEKIKNSSSESVD